jgi:hypothetical protein
MKRKVLILGALAVGGAVALPAWAAKEDADVGIKKQLDRSKVRYEVDDDGDFKVTYETTDGRTQLAFVRSTTFDYGTLKVREIISAGYRSDSDLFPQDVANRMLEHNNEAKLGAWTKQGRMAVFTSKISADASDKELVDAIEITVTLADELEKEFTGDKDEF